jgi:spore germination cell wall hydrolase CwlJ-like protein
VSDEHPNPLFPDREKLKRAFIALGVVCFLFWLDSFHTQGWEERTVAAVLVAEAGGEGKTGMEAVAEVMLNRQFHSHRQIIEIVREPYAFSCLNKTSRDRLYARALRHRRFKEALLISRILFRDPSALPRRVNGADHYATPEARPSWAEGIEPVAIIGHHIFWKLDS